VSDDQVLTLDGLPFDLRGYIWDVNLVNTHTSLVGKDSEYTDHGDVTMGEDQPCFHRFTSSSDRTLSSPTCIIHFL